MKMSFTEFKQRELNLANFFRLSKGRLEEKKSIILMAGTNVNALSYIKEGVIEVIAQNESGDEIIIDSLTAGDFFGQACMDKNSSASTVTLVALTDCHIESVSFNVINNLPANEQLYLNRLLLSQQSQFTKTSIEKNLNAYFDTVEKRLVKTLKELGNRSDAISLANGDIEIKTTRQKLALMAGCSRENAGRIIKSYHEQGLLWARGKTMILKKDFQ
jgi:CRP-like cAMP-binding protein